MTEARITNLSPGKVNLAMRLSILTGCLGTVWGIACSPQAIFNVFFQNQLGASASTLGALVGLLQLSGLFQLVSIFVYGVSSRKKPFFIAAHLIHRVLTLFIAAAAFVAAANGNRSWGIKAIIIAIPISWAFMNASSSGWWSWVADLFPEKIRGSFFLKRSAITNVVNVVWFFLASMLLDVFDGPSSFYVYGFIFIVGAVAGIIDIVLNIFIPEPVSADRPVFTAADALLPLKDRNFIGFSVATGIAIFSINLIVPFQAPFVVDPTRVGAPNTWLGIMFVISQLTWVLTAPFWGTVMDKWGRKPVVILGCFFSLSWIGYFFLTPRSFTYLLPLISIAYGLLAPAFFEGINQMMLSLTPTKNRIAFVAWYMTIAGVVSAGGSLAGGAIFDALSGFSLKWGPFRFLNFHVVQLLAILMVLLSAWILSRVREGKERPIAFVAGRVVNPLILRTYAYMEDIAGSYDPDRAEQALRAIESETGDLALDEITARLDDPYPEIQEEAARALGRIGSPLTVDSLVARLEDPSSSIRIAAARALGKIRDRRAVEPLARTLREGGSEELQDACVQALGNIGGERAVEEVLNAYRTSPSDRVRAGASDSASRLGLFEAAWEIYPRLYETGNPSLRHQYAIAFGNLMGSPGEFYRYVSGSETGMDERVAKLFGRLQTNVSATLARLVDKKDAKALKAEKARSAELAEKALEFLGTGKEEEALSLMMEYSDRLLLRIFGRGATEEGFTDFAFRVDQKLGTFVWMLAESRRHLDGGFAHAGDGRDVCKLFTLLIVYYLASS